MSSPVLSHFPALRSEWNAHASKKTTSGLENCKIIAKCRCKKTFQYVFYTKLGTKTHDPLHTHPRQLVNLTKQLNHASNKFSLKRGKIYSIIQIFNLLV